MPACPVVFERQSVLLSCVCVCVVVSVMPVCVHVWSDMHANNEPTVWRSAAPHSRTAHVTDTHQGPVPRAIVKPVSHGNRGFFFSPFE